MAKQSKGELVEYLVARGYLERAADPTDGRASDPPHRPRLGGRIPRARDERRRPGQWSTALREARMRDSQHFLTDLTALLARPEAPQSPAD